MLQTLHTVLAFIVAIGILVLCHEFGHFIVARFFKIRVDGFGIGMGPKLYAWKRGDTEYRINALPVGGYCKMAGEEDNFEDPDGFFAKAVVPRFLVVFAGPFFNLLLALVIFCFAGMTMGIPSETSHSVVWEVLKDTPAEKAGVKADDLLMKINGQDIKKVQDVQNFIRSHPGERLMLEVERHSKKVIIGVTAAVFDDNGKKIGRIGIKFGPKPVFVRTGVVKSVSWGLEQTYQLSVGIVQALATMLARLIVHHEAPKEIGGPVAIAQMAGRSAETGIRYFILFIAMISINLGIINLFPFPALDGGRLIFLAAEMVRGKKLDPKKENVVHLVGFALLMLLMVGLVYKDIMQLLPKK